MKNKNTIWWLIAFGWCGAIALVTSSPQFTGDSTEQMLENPYFDAELLNIVLRKTGHFVAFGLLAIFFWLALRGTRYHYFLAWLLATTYGAIDEWHQSFIPERSALVSDVVLNSFGAFISLLSIYVYRKKIK